MPRTTGFLSRWGFALLVATAAASAVAAAVLSAPPGEVPAFALRAAVVYQLEVGAAVFLALYLGCLALVLALHNRGFSEIGTGSVKATSISGESREQEDAVTQLIAQVNELEDVVASLATERVDG